jgi:hypothetical protein
MEPRKQTTFNVKAGTATLAMTAVDYLVKLDGPIEHFNSLDQAILLGLSRVKTARVTKLKDTIRARRKLTDEDMKGKLEFARHDDIGNAKRSVDGIAKSEVLAIPPHDYEKHYFDFTVRSWDWESMTVETLIKNLKEL